MSNAQNKPFFIAPVTNPTDEYAAGYDNNRFATREEAEAEIPHLAAAPAPALVDLHTGEQRERPNEAPKDSAMTTTTAATPQPQEVPDLDRNARWLAEVTRDLLPLDEREVAASLGRVHLRPSGNSQLGGSAKGIAWTSYIDGDVYEDGLHRWVGELISAGVDDPQAFFEAFGAPVTHERAAQLVREGAIEGEQDDELGDHQPERDFDGEDY